MKLRSFLLILVVGLFLIPSGTEVLGQTQLMADIPFEFTICQREMAAGKYYVRVGNLGNPRVLVVRSEDNSSVEVVCTRDVQANKRAEMGKMIFNRYGDQYFLSEIWLPGETIGSQLLKSEKEAALIKKRGKVTIKITEVKP
jgi:hypothetical protein